MSLPGGLFASLQGSAATLLAIVHTRLELLGNEIETEKLRAMRMLVLALAAMFCAGVGVLLAVALLALILWEQRVAVIGLFVVVFGAAVVYFYRSLLRMVDPPQPAFAATVAELKEDIRRLKAASDHADPSG